jgi:hypothetical protein
MRTFRWVGVIQGMNDVVWTGKKICEMVVLYCRSGVRRRESKRCKRTGKEKRKVSNEKPHTSILGPKSRVLSATVWAKHWM